MLPLLKTKIQSGIKSNKNMRKKSNNYKLKNKSYVIKN